jgi:hypothetical protein
VRNLTLAEKVEEMTEENIPNPYDQYSIAAITDVILYQLSSKKVRNSDKNRPINSIWIAGEDTLEWVNLKYAYIYLHRFFLPRPHKPFEIHKSHLTSTLIARLEQLQFIELNKIMVDVVRRILETVDSYCYHTSGIHGEINWRFVD